MLELEELLEWSGVVLGVGGAVLSAPSGVRHVLSNVRGGARRAWGWFLERLPGLRRKVPPIVISPEGIASQEGFGNLTASGTARILGGDLDTRVAQLREAIDELKGRMEGRLGAVDETLADHEAELGRIEGKFTEAHREVMERFGENETKAAVVAAEGLPVIAAGIFLSGVPKDLAIVPAVGWAFLAAALVISLWCTLRSIRSGVWNAGLA